MFSITLIGETLTTQMWNKTLQGRKKYTKPTHISRQELNTNILDGFNRLLKHRLSQTELNIIKL